MSTLLPRGEYRPGVIRILVAYEEFLKATEAALDDGTLTDGEREAINASMTHIVTALEVLARGFSR